MAISTLPAPSAGKVRYAITLTSGTSWTVPTGVTYVNVTLYGAGSGASNDSLGRGHAGNRGQIVKSNVAVTAGASIAYAIGAGGAFGSNATSGAGGNTTFADATTANGGAAQISGSPATVEVNTGNGGIAQSNQGGNNTNSEGQGASGKIELEYWL